MKRNLFQYFIYVLNDQRGDLNDNLSDDTGNKGLQGSSEAAVQGDGISCAPGTIELRDGTIISTNVNNFTETDPGVLAAFENFADNTTQTSEAALNDAAAAQGSAAALTSQALKMASDLSAQESKTPLQQLTPFIIAGVVALLGIVYFMTKKG